MYYFFMQFSEIVNAKLENVKRPILKELKEYVRIASWKDVNVFALKESAKRTHHHLNKLVKKYRLGLTLHVRDVIASYHENIPVLPKSGSTFQVVLDCFFATKSSYVSNVVMEAESDLLGLPGRLQQAPRLFLKSQTLSRTAIECQTLVKAAADLDESSAEILERITEFQSGGLIKENAIKGQKMVRKKAWVDLLKHLALIGLSTRSSQKYREHQNVVYMNLRTIIPIESIIPMDENSFCAELVGKAEVYHFRNIARLEIIRKLAISHSPDISSLELSKSVSFLDHLMHLSLERRSTLASSIAHITEITDICVQMKDVLRVGLSDKYCIFQCRPYVASCHDFLAKIWIQVEELFLIADIQIKNALIGLHEKLTATKAAVFEVLALKMDEYFWSATISFLITDAQNLLNQLHAAAVNLSAGNTGFMLQPLLSLLKLGIQPPDLCNSQPSGSIQLLAENCLEKAMIVIQNFQNRLEFNAEDNENFLVNAQQESITPFISGSVEEMLKSLNVFCVSQSMTHDFPVLTSLCRNLMPLVDQALCLIRFRFMELLVFHKTCVKFEYILSNTFYSVIKNGFCLPTWDDDKDEGGTEEDVNGVGIGEGDGKKDVSDEIENEDQVEALQNESEKAPDPQRNIEDEENGIEMENDFDGKMEDLDDVEGLESEDEDDDAKELEEQMGGLDDSAEAVDEKLWDGDSPENDADEVGKAEKDDPVDACGAESELAAQREEGENNEDADKGEKKQDATPEGEEEIPKEEDAEGKINEDEPEMYGDPNGLDVKPADDMQDNENMDIADDLDLDFSENDENQVDEGEEREETSKDATEDAPTPDDAPIENESDKADSAPEEFPEVERPAENEKVYYFFDDRLRLKLKLTMKMVRAKNLPMVLMKIPQMNKWIYPKKIMQKQRILVTILHLTSLLHLSEWRAKMEINLHHRI